MTRGQFLVRVLAVLLLLVYLFHVWVFIAAGNWIASWERHFHPEKPWYVKYAEKL